MSEITTRLAALEPKRWWHWLGFKRQYVDFNISYTLWQRGISFKCDKKGDKVRLDNITIRKIGTDENFVGDINLDGGLHLDGDWSEDSNGWTVDPDKLKLPTVEEIESILMKFATNDDYTIEEAIAALTEFDSLRKEFTPEPVTEERVNDLWNTHTLPELKTMTYGQFKAALNQIKQQTWMRRLNHG